jgi:4-amino-4-deoxy-L-arabinose transferase-like glycosyltransferase
LLAYVAVVLPWTVVVEHRQPGFLRYTLLTESWRRFTTDQMDRTGPLWYFLPVLLAGAFPWLLAALAAVRARRREARERLRDPRLVFLALWVVLPLLFFTVSQSKRPHYVLPLVPALALLAAQSLGGTDPPLRPVRAGALGWLVSGILLLVAGTTRVASTAGVDPALASSIRWTAAALGALALTAAALSWAGARHRLAAGIALSLPLVLLPLVTAPLLERIADARSARGLGAALRPHLTTESAVVAVDSFSPSLVFYLGRSILVSDASPGRLGSNYISSRPRDWTADGSTLRPAGWWQREAAACPRPTFFVIERPFEPQRAALAAAGLPLLYDDGELAALGPCVPRAPAPAALRPAATPTRSADLDPGPQWARLGR